MIEKTIYSLIEKESVVTVSLSRKGKLNIIVEYVHNSKHKFYARFSTKALSKQEHDEWLLRSYQNILQAVIVLYS